METEESGNEPISRTIEQVNEIADIAGLHRRIGMVQTLTFGDLSSSEYKLMELPNDVLATVQQGECVTIRGDTNEEAVLCTQTGSYEIKAADTSNVLFLLPSIVTPKSTDFDKEQIVKNAEIVGSLSSYFELKKTKPKLSKLRYLLQETKYKGPAFEEQHTGSKLTFDDLLYSIQASETELREGLENIGAFHLQGFWRVLDISYKEKAFSQVLKLLDEEGWSFEEVPLERASEILEELYPRDVIKHCLELYGERAEYQDNSEVTYRLTEDKVCQFFAECILRGVEKFNHHEFFEAWQQSVPDGMHTKPEQLRGLALEDTNTHPPVIWHFPAADLPEDPLSRFNALFKVRQKWTRDEIEPYISDLCGPTQSMNALFLKFARCSTDSLGNKIYNSKRPIS
eukprot:Seg1415.12 transcript_id=Seg1415.12/GoldUCD/mRNA.D3Y31 product="Sister chromatid cohesion protein DCC1" protein_id=Seg1415.12/GoldUCD/D3Y31